MQQKVPVILGFDKTQTSFFEFLSTSLHAPHIQDCFSPASLEWEGSKEQDELGKKNYTIKQNKNKKGKDSQNESETLCTDPEVCLLFYLLSP